MTKKELSKLCAEIIQVIGKSKPTFFVKNNKVKIPAKEWLREQKDQICNDIEIYFYNKLK